MNKRRKLLVGLTILSIIGLIGIMLVINATVAGMYDSWGEGLHYKSVLVPVSTFVPTPLIVALCTVIVFAKNLNVGWILRFLEVAAWVQAGFVLLVPVLLVVLEGELNGPTIIVSGFGICICCALAVFIGILRNEIQFPRRDSAVVGVSTSFK